MKSSCDVIHDASILLDIRPACVVELYVARFARTKDQTAHDTWPRKHSVHGLVAQKRRAGVLATAGARAWPKAHACRETKPQLRARKVVCIPLLIPQPDRERYQFFSVSYHI